MSEFTEGDNARPAGRNYLSLVPREGSPLNGGDNARQVAGDGEDLTDGDDSELIGGHDSELIGGNYSWLVARDAATLVAGDGSTLIGGIGTTFTAGVRSTFVVLWWDAQACRCRVLTGEVGEGGLEPGVLYRCVEGRWVAGAEEEP